MARTASSLAAQLALLNDVAPVDDDMYDDFHRPQPSKSASHNTKPQIEEDEEDDDDDDEEDAEDRADDQYEDSDTEDDSLEDQEQEQEQEDQELEGSEDESEQEEDDHEDEDDDDGTIDAEDQGASANPLANQAAESELLLQSLQAELATLASRGRAIKRQQREWDSILELRIRAQKVVRAGMRIEAAAVRPLLNHSETSEQTRSQHAAALRQLDALSASLFVLRAKLLSRPQHGGSDGLSLPKKLSLEHFEEEQERANKRIKLDASGVQEADEEDDEARQTSTIQNLLTLEAKTLNPLAFSVLNSTHHRFNAGAAAGGQGGANKFKNAAAQTPAEQIEASLSNSESKRRLLERTQVWKGDEDRIRVSDVVAANDGKDLPDPTVRAADPDIFDDADLYSHLLRELIEAKTGRTQSSSATATSSPSEINADLTLLAPSTLFGNKKSSKRNVDTRASKGRKIRYEINEKIANFMPPVPTRLLWDEEQIDRLFTKLNTRLGDQDVVKRTSTSARDEEGDGQADAGDATALAMSNPVIDGLQLFG